MLVAVLLDVQTAILVAVVSAVMVALNAGTVTGGHTMEVFVYALAGGIVGALFMWRMEQIGAFFQSAVYVALVNLAVIVAFRLPTYMLESSDLTQLLVAGAINALLCASLTFVAFAFLGRVFGIATSLQLLELARPTHPLFQQLLINAPGTYHHSIVISNMAERAAGAIGADTLLSRVGSYYHDIGKVVRPYFFAENQSDGENPHDKLDPRTSAEIIIAHTTEAWPWRKSTACRSALRLHYRAPRHNPVTYFYRGPTRRATRISTRSTSATRPQAAEQGDGHRHAGRLRGGWCAAKRPGTAP
jgi:putative nucleotidyltransferase with HDIG domain